MNCPHCKKELPNGLIMCFHCGKPLQQPQSVQSPVRTAQKGKKPLVGIISAAVAVLVIGGTVGGHFIGLYTLPFLPEKSYTVDDDDDDRPRGSKTSETEEQPEDTKAVISQNPVSEYDINAVYNEYGYTNLNVYFNTVEAVAALNQGSLGVCDLSFEITGDTSDIADVGVAYIKSQGQIDDLDISRYTTDLIPVWKENEPFNNVYSSLARADFPIYEDDCGFTYDVLLIVLDKNYDPIGHILIPVTMPTSFSNEPAEEMAISERASASGFSTSPQSEYKNTPPAP
jgi:hypothetical protein